MSGAEPGLLVDTDVLSYVVRGQPEANSFAPLLLRREASISFVTVGELFFGAMNANWGKPRITDMEETLRGYKVLRGTYEVGRLYGTVKRTFRDQVGENDLWIAATALAHELPIITNNLRHFEPMSAHFGFGLVHPDLS